MSFEKIDKQDVQAPQGRECILVYGFGGKDLQMLKSYCMIMGIKDIIQIHANMLGNTIGDILEDASVISEEKGQGPAERAVIFNGFSGQKLNAFISNFRSTGITQPLLATVTPTSIKWTFEELITELQREREAIAKSKQVVHEDNL